MRDAAPIIGIDLGTTNSCAAVIGPDGKVRPIPYKGGEFTIPSVFAVDDKGNELVGIEAKRQWQLNPRHTIHASKRLIGQPPRSDVVETMGRQVAYQLRAGEQEVLVEVAGRTLRMADVAAKILAKIVQVARDHLDRKVDRAVVTVPAYFNDRQRQAVKEAGRKIDLDIVRIINEPTAASLAYGAGRELSQRVLVYDLGGGTFDVSIIEIRGRVFEVKATGGDIFLGGIDFDQSLIDHVLEGFRAEHGIDLSGDPVAMQRIKDLAERTKIDLSTSAEVAFRVPFVTVTPAGRPLDIETIINRQILEKLVGPHVDRSLQLVARVLVDADLSSRDIDEVLLVGGQTRMPLIQERITRFFGKAPSKAVHPDEAVAIGAALYAHSLEDDTDLRLQLLDVIPMAIGVETAGGAMHVVFPRNAAIPNAKRFTATTSMDGQTELAVRIFQGDNDAVGANEFLGEFAFAGMRPAPAGEAQVEITFDVNIEGILTTRARDVFTGREMKTTVRVVAP